MATQVQIGLLHLKNFFYTFFLYFVYDSYNK